MTTGIFDSIITLQGVRYDSFKRKAPSETGAEKQSFRRKIMTKEKAIQRAFDRLNLIGVNADVYEILYQYKVFREMDESELDEIYNELVARLGF